MPMPGAGIAARSPTVSQIVKVADNEVAGACRRVLVKDARDMLPSCCSCKQKRTLCRKTLEVSHSAAITLALPMLLKPVRLKQPQRHHCCAGVAPGPHQSESDCSGKHWIFALVGCPRCCKSRDRHPSPCAMPIPMAMPGIICVVEPVTEAGQRRAMQTDSIAAARRKGMKNRLSVFTDSVIRDLAY